jgi:Trk K+ transport system NAD-binding subunit
VLGVHTLPGGSELLELKAGDGSAIAGRRAGDAGLPDGCLVASIVRAGEVLVPCGTEVIMPRDRVLVVAAKSAVAGTQRAFKSPA